MAGQYSLKTFLRKAPNSLLREYLAGHGVGDRLRWGGLVERSIDPIARAIEEADEEVRRQIECDFQEINTLADEGGTRVLIEEGRDRHHQVGLAELADTVTGPLEFAFLCFVRHPDVFRAAKRFHHADGLGRWRKRKDLPEAEPSTSEDSVHRLEGALSDYYRRKQARGKACKVDRYARGERLYWFAYPEGYAVGRLVWDNGELRFQTQRPAFEVIFVYQSGERSPDTWARGDEKTLGGLRQLLVSVILGVQIPSVPPDEVVYDPSGLLSRRFPLPLAPEDGIESVRVKALALSLVGGGQRRVSLEADPETNAQAVYDLLEEVLAGERLSEDMLYATAAKLQLVFRPEADSHRTTLTFTVGYPNSCALKHEPRHDVARQLLKRWRIDVSERAQAPTPKRRPPTQRTFRV